MSQNLPEPPVGSINGAPLIKDGPRMERRRFPRLPQRHGFLLVEDSRLAVGRTLDWSEGGYYMELLDGDPPVVGNICLVYVPELSRLCPGVVVTVEERRIRLSLEARDTARPPPGGVERRRYPRLPSGHGFILTAGETICVGTTVDHSPQGYCMRVLDGVAPAVGATCLVFMPERMSFAEGVVVAVDADVVRVSVPIPDTP